ncbi:hypothetical protein E1J38_001460 [Seonamhaeicola sediminis]|uniref:Polysaccharide lyase family 7 protein n=1 Tax=Seonamhaeicola sediminis TaxID=2528206 RepID=A0A562YIN9_9FLAO|nr:hypothetical protein [Seonamhaeicola sediminis]TWO34549.1 hypothetical protein E1J38_001460 [Seonamhaeicola sediminis]
MKSIMIKPRMPETVFFALGILLVIILACSNDSSSLDEQQQEEPTTEEPKDTTPTNNQNCDEASDFPDLGPSASQSQSCEDVSNPNNKGTLDCRTDNTVGGYENVADAWGSYKISGGAIRYDGTRTRVERFFKNITQGNNKKTILSGSFKIIDLSDGNTCIIQSHAGGNILKGLEAGSSNRSAQFLIYAKKGANNNVQLEIHITINPYTSDTGGARDVKDFITLNYNQEYAFSYETGYDSDGTAFSKIKVGDSETYIEHNHTTERVYTRYGAYGTSDSGDVTAHVEFKDVELCRE